MAGDEDDDIFGDFTFVSNHTSTNQNNHQNVNDDDDWGEFITTPKQQDLQPSNLFSVTHNPSNTFVDQFNIVTDQSKLNHVESRNKLETTPTRSWDRVRGALPLSIFGEDDVEQEQEADVDHRSSNGISSKQVKNEPNFGSAVNLSDMIVSLYGQQGSNSKLDDKTEEIENENGSNSNGKIDNVSNGGDDDDEWEFKDAISVSRGGDVEFVTKKEENVFDSWVAPVAVATTLSTATTTKPTERKVQESSEGSLFDFGDNNAQLNSDWLVASERSSYNPTTVANGVHFESGLSTGNNGDWFAASKGNSYNPTTVDNRAHFEKAASTGNNPQLSGDWFVTSEGNSYNPSIVDNGTQFKSALTTGNIWNTKSPTQPGENATENVNNIYLVNGIASDESFGDFMDASPNNKAPNNYSEQQPKQIGINDGNNMNWVNGTIDVDGSFGHFNDASSNSKASDSYPEQQSQKIAAEHENIYATDGAFDSDESFGDFTDASPNTKALNASFDQEELKSADKEDLAKKGPSIIGETQYLFEGSGKALENGGGALPLSIFGDDKLDSEESLFGQDVFSFKPAASVRNGMNAQVSSSNISLNDLIFDLYSQAEKTPAVVSTRDNTEDGYSSTEAGLKSTSENVGDDFDRSSWEFKAASDANAEYSSPVVGPGSVHQKLSTEAKIMNYVEFYSKLKDEAGFIILHHIDDLKNAQKVAALSGDDTKAAALHEEIQAAYNKLIQENIVSEDADLMGQTARRISVNELLAATEEEKFVEFESEYRLSQRISLAEQNMVSAIELFEHAISVLKILKLGSGHAITSYTTAWSRMISACGQELKHAASIWKQSLEKDIHKQILSKPQGQRYILALGEIYRVAEVLRVSATIYKPWILSSLTDPNAIFASFEECNSVWSNSGIDDALQSLSDTADVTLNGNVRALVESIKSIRELSNLDLLSSQHMEQTCRMSLLSLEVIPAMKMVLWDGEHYFLTLANFWANLVSCDPPKLSHILVNS